MEIIILIECFHLKAAKLRQIIHFLAVRLTHRERADPFADPCFYLGSPGTSYVVYPGRNGKPIPSQRLKVMKEAFDDYALLKTLENKIGRAAVLGMIEEAVGRVGCDVAVPGEGLLMIRDRALELL